MAAFSVACLAADPLVFMTPGFPKSSGGGTNDTAYTDAATNAVLNSAISYSNRLAANLVASHDQIYAFASGLRIIANGESYESGSLPIQLLSNFIVVTNTYPNQDLVINVNVTSADNSVTASSSPISDRSFGLTFSSPAYSEGTASLDFYITLSCSLMGSSSDSPVITKPFYFTGTF